MQIDMVELRWVFMNSMRSCYCMFIRHKNYTRALRNSRHKGQGQCIFTSSTRHQPITTAL